MIKKKWLVGVTMDGKTLIKEYHDGINTHGLWVHRQFQALNPERNGEIQSWLDICKSQWQVKVTQIKDAKKVSERLQQLR